MGGTGLALAFVGILTMFNNRPIIVGLLTLGYATLGLLFVGAGILVGTRRPFATLSRLVLAGGVAGTIAGALIAVLPAVMSFVNLRSIFIALDKPLLDMLTFYVKPSALGIACLPILGAVLGVVGVLIVALPLRIRRPLSGGLVAVGLAGLFQELIRPILANSSATKPLHDLLYTYTGLKLQGAVIIFCVTLAFIVIRDHFGDRVTAGYDRLSPSYAAHHHGGPILPPLPSSPSCSRFMPATSSARSC